MSMKPLLTTLLMLLTSLWAVAQHFESGTVKTHSFYNYKSGDNTYARTEVAYLINSEQDGKMEFYTQSLGNVRITGVALYAVDGEDRLYVANGFQTLSVEDVAAGLYEVRVSGQPTDKAGQGGTFQVGYVLTPADYVNDPEPNNTWERAYQIESGNLQHGHLGYKRLGKADDEDWFQIVVPDEGTVTFTTHSSTKLELSYLGMYTKKDDGSGVDFRNDKWMSGDGKDTTIVYSVPNVAPGTYYVRLRRNSGYGSYKMKYTFVANGYGADDRDNDTWDKGKDLALDTPNDGRLGYHFNGDYDNEDWYKIVVPEEGKLTFTTKTDPTLGLSYVGMYTKKADGTGVDFRNDRWMNGDGKDSTVVYEVPDVSIGTYYVRVRRNSGYGGYRLTCYFTSHAAEADPEPNDTWQEAMPLKSGPAVTGQLGYTFNGDTDNADWYKIEVPKEGSVVFSTRTETTLRLSYVGMYTVKADGTGVDFRNDKWMSGDGKDTTIVYTVPDVAPGTYYVWVRRNSGYGTYTLQYIHNPNVHKNDPEVNNEWTQATLIESGATQQGCLGYHFHGDYDNEDWFKIELPDEGKVTLATTTETTLQLSYVGLYTPKADGTNVEFRNDKWMSGDGKDTTMVYEVPDCKPGTYYVRVRRNSGYGGYKLDYTFTPNSLGQDNLDNDTWDKATLIETNSAQQGRLGYHFHGDYDNEDWFKIELPDEGKVTLATTTETTLRLSYVGLYTPKADGTNVDFRNDKWMSGDGKDTTVVYEVPDCKPGTYYVRVRRNTGYGGYNLDYTFTPNVYGADVAANDSIQGATTIETGVTQQGRLGYNFNGNADNEDWYVIDVPYVGNVTFSVKSETTLGLSYLGLYLPKENGTGVDFRSDKWVSGEGKDTTIIYAINGLGAGKYYVRLRRNSGYGGYALKYEYERNPYDRDNLQNYDFANRYTLTEGQLVSTTMGYAYRKQNNEDWYDLGLMHGRQIDVTIAPDTTHTLVIGVPALYIYKGDNANGSPILQEVAQARIERSQGTISYIDKNTEDQHYVFRVPNYSGSSYGGYTIIFGKEQTEEGTIELANTNVSVMTGGRNTVRKGVPCENPITVTNTSDRKSSKFLVSVTATDNIDIIGFRMPGRHGTQYVPVDSVTVLDGGNCQHTVLFLVPSLDPWESYTFTMISEGKGDIAYVPAQRTLTDRKDKISVNSGTYALVNILGNVTGASKHINVDDFIVHRIGDVYDLTGEQRLKLTHIIQGLGAEKQESGVAAYSVYSLLKRASGECGINLLDATCPIYSYIRRYVLYWIGEEDFPDGDEMDIIDGKAAITDVVASWDPNEMVGPQGVGDAHYIGQTQTMNYRILFENKAEAGDAAYRVRISDALDPDVFDVSTVRFGETSHDGLGYNWEMKRDGNTLSWDIKGIELPPNVNAPEGEGYVTFSVDLKPGLPDGAQIKNKATIIFDKNFPIETNEYVNTLDLTPPTTLVGSIQFDNQASALQLNCESTDAASGVNGYLLFVSKDGGEYTYEGQFNSGQISYPVGTDGNYSAYVLAVDAVGNTERIVPQTSTITLTGIKATQTAATGADADIYTLDGRYAGRTLSRQHKGVYVVGGRKLIVK